MIKNSESFSKAIETNLDRFFKLHEGENPDSGLYDRIIKEVEKILIKKTLDYSDGVQVNAARILGINRNTLRKKIKELDIS